MNVEVAAGPHSPPPQQALTLHVYVSFDSKKQGLGGINSDWSRLAVNGLDLVLPSAFLISPVPVIVIS